MKLCIDCKYFNLEKEPLKFACCWHPNNLSPVDGKAHASASTQRIDVDLPDVCGKGGKFWTPKEERN